MYIIYNIYIFIYVIYIYILYILYMHIYIYKYRYTICVSYIKFSLICGEYYDRDFSWTQQMRRKKFITPKVKYKFGNSSGWLY